MAGTPRKYEEADNQTALVAWAWYQHKLLLIHYPAELMRFLNAPQKARQAKMGTKAGLPDLFLFEPVDGACGLVIEMKSRTGRVKPEQLKWLQYFHARGWHVAICRSFEEGKETIEQYLDLK